MNKWTVFSVILLLMFASMILGFMLGYPPEDPAVTMANAYTEGYNTAVREIAFIQLDETVIFLPINETVEKVDLNNICGWAE